MDERVTGSAQFADSFLDYTGQRLFAAQKKNYLNLAAIAPVALTFDKAALLQSIKQFHGAVVLDGETLRERTDRGGFTLFEAADGEKHLVLLRFETFRKGGCVAFTEKKPNPVAQFGQGAILRGGNLFRHSNIISWNDISRHVRRFFTSQLNHPANLADWKK